MNILKYINKILMMIIPILIFMFVSTIIYNKLINKEIDIKDKGSTYLKELIIDNHDIVFNKNTEEYFISLNNNETSLSIKAIPEDNSAKVSIFNNDDLTKHDKVYIYVTSKDHEIKKYTINYNNKNAIIYFKTNVEGCSRIDSDYCLKFFNVNSNNNDNFLLFSYDSLTNEGYPKTNFITVNDKIVFNKNLIDGEFKNFNIIDNNIIFTYGNKKEQNKIYLYGIDTNGNIILNKTIINSNYKNLYTYDFKYNDQTISLKTRYTLLDKTNICKLKDEDIIEARYKIFYKNGQFGEPTILNKLTVLEYKIIMNIKC